MNTPLLIFLPILQQIEKPLRPFFPSLHLSPISLLLITRPLSCSPRQLQTFSFAIIALLVQLHTRRLSPNTLLAIYVASVCSQLHHKHEDNDDIHTLTVFIPTSYERLPNAIIYPSFPIKIKKGDSHKFSRLHEGSIHVKKGSEWYKKAPRPLILSIPVSLDS